MMDKPKHTPENWDGLIRAKCLSCESENISIILDPLAKAAPELLEAAKAQHNAIDELFARLIILDKNFFPSKSGKPWAAMLKGNVAITKAEGKEGT